MVFSIQQIFADMFWSDVSSSGQQQLCLWEPTSRQGYFPGDACLIAHDDSLGLFPIYHCMKAE
jgi:hypothetical protein